MCVVALATVGCTYEKVIYDPWARLREIGEKPKSTPPPAKTVASNSDVGWVILLESFQGDKRDARAALLAKRLTVEARLSDVWVKQTKEKTLVLRGHYNAPTAPTAEADLEQTRGTELDGLRPYERVQIVSLRGDAPTSEFDLKRYVGQNLYSLQVAAFDDVYDKDYHKAAEAYAAELRAKGDQAFFYHGANLSIVTIGLFTDDDFDEINVERPSPDGVAKFKEKVYGPRMVELQKKHPLNIFDGYTIKQKQPDGTFQEQPSFLVPVE